MSAGACILSPVGIIRDVLLGRPNVATPMLSEPQRGISSPWSDQSSLNTIVWSDMFEGIIDNLPMDRAEAISIPAISKARNLLVSTIAKFPLTARRFNAETGEDTDTTTEHPWLYRTGGIVSPYERMVWTVDDAIFNGYSLWLTDRSSGDPLNEAGRKRIVSAERCPIEWWRIDTNLGKFMVREGGGSEERPLTPDEYMFINYPFEGLLNIANRTMRGARDIEIAWTNRAINPIPLIDLHRTEDAELEDDEVTDMVSKWAEARRSRNGAIGSTPAGVQLNTHGLADPALMTEGRNAIRTDVGSFLNIRAAMLDGTTGVDSLTYTTKEGERNSFYEFDLPFWTDPFEARLSQDDVMPRSQRVRYEKYESSPAPTGPVAKD